MKARWKSKILFTLFILFFSLGSFSQTTDLLRIEYLNIPNPNTNNSIQRLRGLFQLPLKLKDNHYFVIAGEYQYLDLELDNVPFTTDDLNSVQRIEATVGYLYQHSDEWIFAGKIGTRLVSNFDSKMVSDDVLYLGAVYAIRDRTDEKAITKPNRLVMGLLYTTTPGRSFPLPILNYYREFHPDWTYTLGVPKSNIRYKFDEVNHVQAFITLDNFFANIQENKTIDGRVAENISMTIILVGLGYEHYFTEHLLYYGYMGYTLSNDYRLRDNNRDDIYIIENQNSLYFRTGIKFKF